MTGKRLVVGVIVMAFAVPLTLFLLLGLHTISQFLTVATVTFLAWGVSDLLSSILERPRLSDRSPGKALKNFRDDAEGATRVGSDPSAD